jgi:hypothetical protein
METPPQSMQPSQQRHLQVVKHLIEQPDVTAQPEVLVTVDALFRLMQHDAKAFADLMKETDVACDFAVEPLSPVAQNASRRDKSPSSNARDLSHSVWIIRTRTNYTGESLEQTTTTTESPVVMTWSGFRTKPGAPKTHLGYHYRAIAIEDDGSLVVLHKKGDERTDTPFVPADQAPYTYTGSDGEAGMYELFTTSEVYEEELGVIAEAWHEDLFNAEQAYRRRSLRIVGSSREQR